MAPYSMDLRKRVLRAWDAGMDAEAVAAKYEVSRAWVHRLVQRRRETGSIAPRQQTKFRAPRADAGAGGAAGRADHRAARCDAGGVARGAADDGRAEHAVARDRSVGVDRQKKRYTPTNNAGLMSPRRAGSGRTWQPLRDVRQYVFLDECGVTTDLLRRYGRSPRGTRLRDHTPCSHWQTHTVVAGLRLDGLARRRCSMGRSTIPRSSPTSSRSWCRRCGRAMSSCSTTSRSTNNPAVRAAIERAGAHLRFLPPYSPDFNPIELAFAKLKAFLRAARPRSFDQVVRAHRDRARLFTPHRMRQLHAALRLPRRYSVMKNALAGC